MQFRLTSQLVVVFAFVLSFSLALPAANARILSMKADLEAISQSISAGSGNESIIVLGSRASSIEKLLLKYARENYKELAGVPLFKEEDFTENITTNNSAVYIIGGPKESILADKVVNEGKLLKEYPISFGTVKEYSFRRIKHVIVSDKRGYGNYAKNTAKSPLSKVVPQEYVPAAAAGITLLLLWLGKILYALAFKIARVFVSSRIMSKVRKKEIKKSFSGFTLKGVRIKYREWLSIFLAAVVFAVAASYIYIFEQPVVPYVLMHVGVNSVIYALRHGTRLWLDKVHNIHTEYMFWYWGAILTIISGWLGSTFSLAGYTVSETKKGEKEEGHIGFVTNIATFFAFLIFAVWNFFEPSPLLQSIETLSISISFLFMLPFKPFTGRYVYRWNRKLWWLGFVPIAVFYVAVNIIV
ncbi:hypothetical protein D6764_02715 [Candidatus Woesearchaeota archaeon]|nr:MAG: hypothetical protein D6764_02715 [Candidatus Woesearchaeota archaeon]